jgi:hypothetical protein
MYEATDIARYTSRRPAASGQIGQCMVCETRSLFGRVAWAARYGLGSPTYAPSVRDAVAAGFAPLVWKFSLGRRCLLCRRPVGNEPGIHCGHIVRRLSIMEQGAAGAIPSSSSSGASRRSSCMGSRGAAHCRATNQYMTVHRTVMFRALGRVADCALLAPRPIACGDASVARGSRPGASAGECRGTFAPNASCWDGSARFWGAPTRRPWRALWLPGDRCRQAISVSSATLTLQRLCLFSDAARA